MNLELQSFQKSTQTLNIPSCPNLTKTAFNESVTSTLSLKKAYAMYQLLHIQIQRL